MNDQGDVDKLDELQDELTEEALAEALAKPMNVANRNSIFSLRAIIKHKAKKPDDEEA